MHTDVTAFVTVVILLSPVKGTGTNHTSADQLVYRHDDGNKWSLIISCQVPARIGTRNISFVPKFLNQLDNLGFRSGPAAEAP